MIEKIFAKAENIFSISKTIVFGIQKIFSVIEIIFFVVETTVAAPENISGAAKTAGEAPVLLVAVTNELE